MIEINPLLDFYSYIHKLKQLPRAGWVLKGVASPESVADHTFSLGLLTLIVSDKLGLDSGKAVKIALLHDIGESIIGDITPHDGLAAETKQADETKAVKQILAEVDISGELLELWLDFDLKRTPEGRLVSQLDKLEAYLQARYYEVSKEAVAEFLASTDATLEDPDLIKLRNKLEKTDINPA